MAKRQFDVLETIRLIRSGSSDLELMERFQLSALELLRLFRKLAETGALTQAEIRGRAEAQRLDPGATEQRDVSARALLEQIKAGRTDTDIMKTYGLVSARELQFIFKKLVDAGLLTSSEITNREEERRKTEPDIESAPTRHYVLFSLPVYDVDDLEAEGFVNEISEEEIEVVGISCGEGAAKSLLIRPDEFADIFPFVVDAECRKTGSSAAGGETSVLYRITDVSSTGRDELRKLIRLLSFDHT